MNERIKELAEQCYYDDNINSDGTRISDQEFIIFDKVKFAELIVRECLNNMENCDGDLDFAIWKTKKDFGIE